MGLGAALGREQGLEWHELPWKAMARTAASGIIARAGINLAVTFVPFVAAAANAGTAFMLTRLYGEWAEKACASPEGAHTPSFREFEALLVDSLLGGRPRPGHAEAPAADAN
jgi:hypothetical protein